MKIAMIASEAAPFIKTGGLGDVMQALPAALARVPGNQEGCSFQCHASGIQPHQPL